MQINYILLDIDGVLNTNKDWKIPFTLNSKCVCEFGEAFKGANVKIILTSSWRKGFISKNNKNNAKYIQKLDFWLSSYGLSVNGVLNYNGLRGKAIYDFCKSHEGVIAIDDDISEIGEYKDKINLVLTDERCGFRKKDLKQIK